MLPKLPRPSAPMIVSVAALVVALGGTSYAAAKIGTNDIEKNAVISSKIANGTVRSADVENGSLRRADLAPNAKTPGPEGPQGPAGADGADGVGRWALVDATGAIVAQSGGFEVKSRYDVDPMTPAGAVGNVYIDANEPLDDNGVVVSIALQNQVDQNADGITNGRSLNPDANPEFSGEITATMCGITGVVACAPAGTNDINHFVVSPRLSDGQVTASTNRKRFYVIVTGDSTDYVAPPTP